ncbi:hypothetical protein PUN28_009989 [Cardiocondyla obscurior]|uniref:Uncharacterized protein n=1 Tax=Cardiocondyla obscurior TaxID=286306 RepID=A0AAW2FNU3_9HYME
MPINHVFTRNRLEKLLRNLLNVAICYQMMTRAEPPTYDNRPHQYVATSFSPEHDHHPDNRAIDFRANIEIYPPASARRYSAPYSAAGCPERTCSPCCRCSAAGAAWNRNQTWTLRWQRGWQCLLRAQNPIYYKIKKCRLQHSATKYRYFTVRDILLESARLINIIND